MTTTSDTPLPAALAEPGDVTARGDVSPATPGQLSWMWELDLDAVLASLTGPATWLRAAARPGT